MNIYLCDAQNEREEEKISKYLEEKLGSMKIPSNFHGNEKSSNIKKIDFLFSAR
jgi:hypothetical protein